MKKTSATKARPPRRTTSSAAAPGSTGLLDIPPAPVATPAKAGKKPASAAAEQPKAARIVARADIGFGNTLFIRGDGETLSWDHGIALENRGVDEWVCELSHLKAPIEFKLLINDQTWSHNGNFTLHPAETLTCEPSF